ncbi:MAG: ATP-dependent DNA helicase RecG [Clostridia bacterium]|nr:ATP-dependent DNA helicase RecG [Clostridia bacterium]
MGIDLYSTVTLLRGVGAAKARSLAGVGIYTINDLLHHYPRAYQNRGDITTVSDAAYTIRSEGECPPSAFILTVSAEPKVSMIRRGMTLIKLKAFDESGTLEITYFNQPFLKDVFHTGGMFRFFGRPVIERGKVCLSSPIYEPYSPDVPLPAIVPVYPLSHGLSQKFMQSLVKEALRIAAVQVKDHLPAKLLSNNALCSLSYALRTVHMPESIAALEAARKRLAFDEIFTLSLAMQSKRSERKKGGAAAFEDRDITPLTSLMPYELTGAQKRSISEISRDVGSDTPMSRILCGDVGSGKTAVAAAAAYMAAKNGYQCAVMAPTEILAKQHFASLSPLFEKLGFECALLCGSLTAANKRKVRESLGRIGGPMIVIGTHALLSEGVEFYRLGLVITDEQHRFGVNQRAALKKKAEGVHSLVMTATPIPRTLSLVIYGDLDVSRLDEMPPGRKKVGTFRVDESYRDRLCGFIRKQRDEGGRTYVVCPAIEESRKDPDSAEEMANLVFFGEDNKKEPPLKAALTHARELQERLPDVPVGYVHGRMKAAEKDAVMEAFARGDISVLVSTTVIEVGVNVPEATLMVVENAERFGLSQLHQLRGRVGRGQAKSYCILVSDSKSKTSAERLDIMCRTNDGFKVAEADLKMRGPGDFFARDGEFRQSGNVDMPFSSGMTDESVMERAVLAATAVLEDDPGLSKNENAALRAIVLRMHEDSEDTIS